MYPRPAVMFFTYPACESANPNAVFETYKVDNGGLENVFVYVKSGLPERTWPAPTEPLMLNQHGCH